MKKLKNKLTLDRPATYQIKVPGHLDDSWCDRERGTMITVDIDETGMPFTTLTATVDQSALQSLLRQLYSLGLPLISVIWVEIPEPS